MSCRAYRYTFEEQISMAEVKNSLMLAVLSAEGLVGRSQVRLDAGFHVNEQDRACIVDASSPAGWTIARIFTGLVSREFGDSAFRVERVGGGQPGVALMPKDVV